MNMKATSPVEDFLTPERIQTKADMLENNLYSEVSKQKDISKAHLVIERKNWPDKVIRKALDQLLPRFNINDVTISHKVSSLLKQAHSKGSSQTVSVDVYNVNNPMQRKRTLEASATDEILDITITGIPAVDSTNGKIEKYFFNYKDYPGKVLKNNKIDFREINKFPSVKAGSDLFLVLHETYGTTGLTFDGIEIPVSAVKPLDLKLHEGVEKIEKFDESGHPIGYIVRAAKTGVVVFDKESSPMNINVKETIEIKQLDYSIGNIGTEYICPIQLNADVICDGFKVAIKGKVEVKFLDGGTIRTDDYAVIDKVQSNSHVTAINNIILKTSIYSTIKSLEGSIIVKQELIDSTVQAPKVEFDTAKGLLTNSSIEAEELIARNILITGENTLEFGTSLFREKKRLQKEKSELEEKLGSLKTMEDDIKSKLLKELKTISIHTKDNKDLFTKFKLLIQMLQTMKFDVLHKVLDALQYDLTPSIIANTKKLFLLLEKIASGLNELNAREEEIYSKINTIEKRLNKMSFSIQGRLRSTAVIKIFCDYDQSKEKREPVLTINSDQDQDKTIQVSGTYHIREGFKTLTA